MANQWFRMYAEFANDPKVQMMSESDQRRLVMLFCLRCNGDVTLHDEEVTFMLRISNDDWSRTKALFISKGFIDSNNNVLNWNARQFISDSSAERVARHRAKVKQACNVTVTPPDTEQIQNRTDKKTSKKVDYLTDIDPQIAQDYMTVRKNKRAKDLTLTSYNSLIKEAQIAGISLEQALVVCIERNWIGFKADWYANLKTTKPGMSMRDQGRAVAASSIFKPEHTSHLSGMGHKELEVVSE